MQYKDIVPISRQEAEEALASGNVDLICDALLRIAHYDLDWHWVQTRCLQFTHFQNTEVRRCAINCLGQLARIRKTLDVEQVAPVLKSLINDPEIGGTAEDALDDIQIFIP